MAEQRLSLLDGVRGLAAFAVILSHYKYFFLVWPGNPAVAAGQSTNAGGAALAFFYEHSFRAVELFWVISGFVFTYVYCQGKSVSTREFAVNRFARLYPLHFLTLIVTAVIQAIAMGEFGQFLIFYQNDSYHFILHLFFASAWGLQKGMSYNDVVWSVSVEIMIYAVFWCLRGQLIRWGSAGALALVVLFGFITLLGPPTFIFACGFFFFSGAAVALASVELQPLRYGKLLLGVGLAGVGAIVLASGHPIFALAIGLNGLFCALVMLAVELDRFAGERIRRFARWLGDCSYGIYLWHIPFILTLSVTLSPFVAVSSLATQTWFLFAYGASILLLAHLSYVHFERPARNWLRRSERRADPPRAVPQADFGG